MCVCVCVCVCVCLVVCSYLVTLLNSWVVDNLRPHFKETPNTLEHYLINARSFIKHIRDSPPDKCRLTAKACGTLVGYLDSLIKSNRKNKVARQHDVKAAKKELLLSPADIKTCVEKLPAEIEECLCKYFGFDRYSHYHKAMADALSFWPILHTRLCPTDCPFGLASCKSMTY